MFEELVWRKGTCIVAVDEITKNVARNVIAKAGGVEDGHIGVENESVENSVCLCEVNVFISY